MKPQPPSSAQSSRRISRLDRRTIYLPAEIPPAFQTGSRRFEATRLATSETQQFQHARDRFAAETTSYFPKIRESTIARDKREKQLALSKQTRQVWRESPYLLKPTPSPQQEAASLPSIPLPTLDQDAVAGMRLVFEKCGQLDEEEFIAEMFDVLNAQNLPWEQQVNVTQKLSSLYRQADLHAVGCITWEDFSTTIVKASDDFLPKEDTISQRLHCQIDALNMPAEIQGIYYFEDVDRVFLHDVRNRGFQMLNAATNTIAGAFNESSSRGILDAVYSSLGRYVITALTSPVITLYDVDKLRIRQQIPTEAGQTSLAYERDPATPRLYSSCTNGQVHVWNMETLTCSHSFFMKGHEVMTDIAAIDKTCHLAASCMDGKIYVLDLHHERIGNALSGHEKGVTMIKYSENKGYLISGGLDHCVNLWNPHVERKIGALRGHKHQLIGLEVIPDTPQIITADESGLIKIWDLRKFAPVRTFKREAYVKDHTLPRTLSRPMRSMCYMPSRKRIAIAHSSLFFVELQDSEENPSSVKASRSRFCEGAGQGSDVEERPKPLVVLLNQPSRCIVVLTPREVQTWAVDTGQLVHRERLSVRFDITCVSVVEDQHSCIVGAEDGTIARVMLPRGAVVLSKRLHSAEVAAIRWVSDSRKVVSSSFDGTVLISLSANLEVLHTLNHWQDIQSMNNNVVRLRGRDNKEEERGPLITTSEVEHLKKLFNSADYAQTGKITTRKAAEILESVFPVPSSARKPCSARAVFTGREAVTMVSLIRKAKTRFKETRRLILQGKGNGGRDAVIIDVHGKLQHLVTVSPYDGSFCVWRLKSGTVAGTGVLTRPQKDRDGTGSTQSELAKLRTALIGQVVYLDPYPYFVLVEEGHPCQLSIWSSKAISSLFPYGHQRIVSLRYDVPYQPDCEQHFEGGTRGIRGNAVICAATWIAGGTNCANLLCVGDDQGYVSIYDFDELFEEIEGIRNAVNSECPQFLRTTRLEHRNANKLLPSSLLRLRSRWLVRQGESIRMLCAIREIENWIAVTLESGATSLFTIDGRRVGDLSERSGPWKLTSSTSDLKTNLDVRAARIFGETKIQRRATDIPQRRHLQEKRDWIRRASTPKTITSDAIAEEYAKQRPGLSRFLAVAKQL